MRTVCLVVMALLVAASTVLPSATYAQKYADHLAQYGGISARTAAISGFAALYVNPDAARLPVSLVSVLADAESPCLPTSCSVEKSVLTKPVNATMPDMSGPNRERTVSEPREIDLVALRGPPRRAPVA